MKDKHCFIYVIEVVVKVIACLVELNFLITFCLPHTSFKSSYSLLLLDYLLLKNQTRNSIFRDINVNIKKSKLFQHNS